MVRAQLDSGSQKYSHKKIKSTLKFLFAAYFSTSYISKRNSIKFKNPMPDIWH